MRKGSNYFNYEAFHLIEKIFLLLQRVLGDLLQPQDKLSRHRGAEPCRRYGRLGTTSLLSPG